jgi:hypothetical protein
MGVLGSLFGGVYAAVGGGSKAPATPPINASSPDEADFIKCAYSPRLDIEASGCLTHSQEVHGAGGCGREEGGPGEALGWVCPTMDEDTRRGFLACVHV